MNERRIIEILKKYNANPDIINDDYYFKSLVEVYESISKINLTKEEIYNFYKNNPLWLLFDICENYQVMNYALDNPIIMDGVARFVEFQKFLELDENKTLNYIKNNDIPKSWNKESELFNYILKHDKSLIVKLHLPFFLEITDDALSKYGKEIIEYIKNNDNIYGWSKNKKLFEYVFLNDSNLASKFLLDDLFPELTDEILEKYGHVIIKFIERVRSYFKSFSVDFYIPVKWKESQSLFKYLVKDYMNAIKENSISNDSIHIYQDLLRDFQIERLFPVITKDILLEYGEVIIFYLEKNEVFPYKWVSNKELFGYVAKHNKKLINKFNLKIIFREITEEMLSEYGELILKYLSESEYSYIRNNECLFKYLLENNISLIKKMNVGSYYSKDEYITLLASKLGMDKKLLKCKLEYLYRKNDEIFKTLDFRILKIDKINMDLLSKFTLYPDIQEKIINLDSSLLDVFSKILNTLISSKYDLTNVVVKVLNNIGNYKKLLMNIKIEQLDEEKIKNLIFILQREENIFQIKNIEDLNDINFQNKKNNYFSDIENNLNDMDLESLKKAIFEKKYAIDYKMAFFIYERYYQDIEELQKSGLSEKIINIIQEISLILNDDSYENLKMIYLESSLLQTDFYTSLFLESAIRKEYAKMYTDTLYQISDKDKSKRSDLQNVNYNGKQINFYEVDADFNMQVHGLGAYREWERPLNFKDDWNRPKVSYHGICTSYIGNNQIATARPNGPILGFSNYEESALMLAGNYDLFSDDAISDYSTAYHTPYSFLPPKTMIDSTRHNHNEMVIERINNDTIISYKRMPNYVVYIVDDINNQDNFSLENEYYQMTLQCAFDMDLPIVIIDRLKYAKSEMKKCQELEKEFYQTKDINVLEELFLTYMNNGVGCRFFEGQTKCEYHEIFSEQVIRDFYQRLTYFLIRDDCLSLGTSFYSEDEVNQLNYQILTLIKLLKHEKESYEVSHKSLLLTPPIDLDNEISRLSFLYNVYTKNFKIKKSLESNEFQNNQNFKKK